MSAVLIRLLVLLAVFATIFILSQTVLSGYLNRRAERQAVNRRLELLRSGITSSVAGDILRKGVPDRLNENASLASRLYYRFQCAVRIADISMAPRTILTISVGAFVAVIAVLLLLAWSAGYSISPGTLQLVVGLSASMTIVIPLMVIFRRKDKRRHKMEQQFPVALDIFTRALKAGHPISSAIDLLTREMEDPLGSEFGIVADEVSFGGDLTSALMDLADRWDLSDARMFAVSISLQNETGGNLAEILENLSGVIRERASMYMKVRALSSEGRMTGWVLSVLPVLTFVILFILNREFYFDVADDPVFITGFTGLIALYLIGVFTIRRMIDLKV
jgi:tight adherence protein B